MSKTTLYWLLMGPAFALLLSWPSGFIYEYLSPGKVGAFSETVGMYPAGLLLSLLTPWGWLMYGGLLMMLSAKFRMGVICTIIGSVILGTFWPIWGTFLSQ